MSQRHIPTQNGDVAGVKVPLFLSLDLPPFMSSFRPPPLSMPTVEAIVANKFPRVFIQFAYVAINCLLQM